MSFQHGNLFWFRKKIEKIFIWKFILKEHYDF